MNASLLSLPLSHAVCPVATCYRTLVVQLMLGLRARPIPDPLYTIPCIERFFKLDEDTVEDMNEVPVFMKMLNLEFDILRAKGEISEHSLLPSLLDATLEGERKKQADAIVEGLTRTPRDLWIDSLSEAQRLCDLEEK